ncbi:centriolar and ciliogenesis-associated protein HYLS1 isoform X2 [Gadus macrocephalus]|uniref:centriolar and ciliogenesis-associated protein HYLS1 isoform X2 n=1 Tax=Gadus macrocephalus TaxID=80720 RepID=UPI0028CB45DE|nr:centriolar and ciliogenesis-associated protein HYLS1 isoform X2 [Gadus macrocephalus]
MDSLDFSEDEIQEQLAVLGYRNIPQHRLREFKRDLDELIQQKKLKILDSSRELNFSNRSQLGANHITTSPPAYTKETGPQCFPSWSGEGSILNAGTGDHHREVLSSWRLNQEPDPQDSYACYTVAPRTLRPSEVPHRLHLLPDPGTHESPVPSDPGSDRLSHPTSQASSPEGGGQGKPFITRKVLRKHKGQFFVCNESVHSEDSDVSSLEERLGGLRVATASAHRNGDDGDEETENEDVTGQSDDITSQSDGRSSSGLSLTALESFVRDMVRMQTERALKPRPKSFIRPVLGHPHTRNLKKMDPLTRYLQYKQEWDMFKVPGEKDRKALRWEIREQLAYQAPPARPRRAYVPNSYIVPTDKKRSALRWEVRNDLANGLLPPKQNYRF